MENNNLEKIENRPAFRHTIPVQMRFNDVDVLGHINNSVYFTYYDLGKSNYFTTVRRGKLDWTRPDVVIANVNCNFYAPIYFGEPVAVTTRVESIGEKSFKVHQRLVNTVNNEVKSECLTVMVAFDLQTKKSMRLPQVWIDAICEYEGRNLLESGQQQE